LHKTVRFTLRVSSCILLGCTSLLLGSRPAFARNAIIVAPILPAGGKAPQLFRLNTDGSDVVQLTTASGKGLPTDANDFPVISANGKKIYFASGRDFSPSYDPMLRTIYVMNIDGTGAKRLTANSAEHCVEYPDDVSPNGVWVIFEMSCDATVVGDELDGVSKLYKIRTDGTDQEELIPKTKFSESALYDLGAAAFTLDGKSLIFNVSTGSTDELYKLDWGTQKFTQLTDLIKKNYWADWRKPMFEPTGEWVYFQTLSEDLSTARVEKVKLDGSEEKVLINIANNPNDAFMDDRFALSPNGERFVFAHGATQHSVETSDIRGQNRVKIWNDSSTFMGWGNFAWK